MGRHRDRPTKRSRTLLHDFVELSAVTAWPGAWLAAALKRYARTFEERNEYAAAYRA